MVGNKREPAVELVLGQFDERLAHGFAPSVGFSGFWKIMHTSVQTRNESRSIDLLAAARSVAEADDVRRGLLQAASLEGESFRVIGDRCPRQPCIERFVPFGYRLKPAELTAM